MSHEPPDRIRLGPLERDVMNHLWATPSGGDVASVHDAVGAVRRLTRNTIHSTLERLVRKGLLARERRGRAYHYAAILSRPAWIAEALDAKRTGGASGEARAWESQFKLMPLTTRSWEDVGLTPPASERNGGAGDGPDPARSA